MTMHARTAGPIRGIAVVRLAWGVTLLCLPAAVLRTAGSEPAAAPKTVLRVLGGRHLAQGIVTLAEPTETVTVLGAAVDVLHGLTSWAFAAVAPRWRRAGVLDGLIATSFAAVSWTARPKGSG